MTSQQRTPIEVPAFFNASGIAVGPSFTCAAVAGSVWCVGSNVHGTLGNGALVAQAVAAPVSGVTQATAVAAATTWTPHGTHACALLQSGSMMCWGRNSAGQLGNQTSGGIQTTATAVLEITDAIGIDVGEGHSCALLADKTARCWGGNYYGPLGDGTFTTRTQPVEPLSLGPITKIATYYRHVCALRVDGDLRCWGECDYGESGNGATGNFNTPQVVQGITDALDIDTGHEHACAILSDRTVACWGADNAGQLGNGTLSTSHTPSPVEKLTDAKTLALGASHSCALKLDGTIWCWGAGSYGQLGDPSTNGAIRPLQVPAISDAEAIYAGGKSTFVKTATGTVYSFGDNQFGQLGLGHAHLRPTMIAEFP